MNMLLWFSHPGFSYNFRSSHAYSIFCEYSLDSTFSWMQSKQQLLFNKEYDCMVGRFVQPVPSEYKKNEDMVHLAHNWSQSNKSWKLVDFFIASSSQSQIAQRCFNLKMLQASLRLPLMLWEWSR